MTAKRADGNWVTNGGSNPPSEAVVITKGWGDLATMTA
eukprot:CAMPEP_0174358512 /NCGR_PEP_ID=MMETSP0811_2-20130205/43189_1 /TAXON_ID=73025 ORGANISM="Eutreptiella gymnastica-like, Strain CCMP1594" /NCGR_SAMPLE_ID=MMETSP0811_2 /ASSEMBLY_ACC=CAM_ASM_000667 /LENGTH=37 /DNA_ID= /DNA_START= /DNA_END= /DNA_ORIENTATION=